MSRALVSLWQTQVEMWKVPLQAAVVPFDYCSQEEDQHERPRCASVTLDVFFRP